MHEDDVVGASKSLNKTISELTDYMNDDHCEVTSELRAKMYAKIAEISLYWMQYGFESGHRRANTLYKKNGTFPKEITRNFSDLLFAPDYYESVTITSKIPKSQQV